MCLISDKIKFCNCVGNAEKLKNYWILYRRKPKGEVCHVLGEPIFPSNLNFEYNSETILKRLIEADAFDSPMDFKDKDRFNIFISSCLKNDKFLSYTFEYRKGNWKEVKYDPFDLKSRFDDIKSGKLESAFRKTQTKTNSTPSKP